MSWNFWWFFVKATSPLIFLVVMYGAAYLFFGRGAKKKPKK